MGRWNRKKTDDKCKEDGWRDDMNKINGWMNGWRDGRMEEMRDRGMDR